MYLPSKVWIQGNDYLNLVIFLRDFLNQENGQNRNGEGKKKPFGREASSLVRPTMSMGSISTFKNETNRKIKLYTDHTLG